jgi:oligopeptide transport system permease protein
MKQDSCSEFSIEKGKSLWSDAWYRLRRNKAAFCSLIFLFIIVLLCFGVPIIGGVTAPEDGSNHWFKDPSTQNLKNALQSFSLQHWFGTDQLGRDLLSRILTGGQISILVGIIATIITVAIGVTYGALSGYNGGKTDTIMMRIVDVFFGLPSLVIIILFNVIISENSPPVREFLKESLRFPDGLADTAVDILPLCVAVGLLGWFSMARIIRAQVISVKNLEFVEAARSLGLSDRRILIHHILPNVLGPIIVYTSLTIPSFILTEAALSFLGLGVKPPTSSWGILLSESANYLETQPQMLLITSFMFSLTLLALNFLGDGISDALDPKASKD